MSMSNSVANAARLDDCHSTIFSLADLSGIKWQKFSSDAAALSNDPILTAFTKCLSLDILAVWRRTPKKSSESAQPAQDTFGKELWVFWWGEEAHIDEIARHQGLRDEDKGFWQDGLSYECRTLLFKAIHNLVERCLLHENFVRIGQWFVKPLLSKDSDEDVSDRFSFSFTFFLHGESSVCTTVEVARHKSLERLSYHHLQQLNANLSTTTVILAPFGLEAKLSGISYRSHYPVAKKLLEEWKMFYPLGTFEDVAMDDLLNEEDAIEQVPVPPVVEVVIGGVSMNYPSHFVLVPVQDNTTAVTNGEVTESCRNKSKPYQYEALSVPSVLDLTPIAPTSARSAFLPRTPVKHTTKSNKKRQDNESNRSYRPRYFANRIRVKKKSALVVCKKENDSASIGGWAAAFSPQINSAKSSSDHHIKWDFKDSFKETRCSDEALASSDTARNRNSNYGLFHHRSLDKTNDSNQPNTSLLPSANAATPKDTSLQQEATPESIFPVEQLLSAPMLHQVPNDKLYLSSIVDDSTHKFISKPFVSLANPADAWLGQETMKPDEIDYVPYPPAESDVAAELYRPVDEWQSYEMPSESCDSRPKQKRLPSHSLDSTFPFHPGVRPAYFCPRSKRLKNGNNHDVNETPPVQDGTPAHPPSQHPFPGHQVSVGTANGVLAGMAISLDPYAFEDVEDPISHATSFSDINLKQSHISLPASQLPWPSMANDVSNKPIKLEPQAATSGKSELELLLMQNNSPAPSTVMPMTSVSYPSVISSVPTPAAKTLKEQLEFTMDDINHFMEDEDVSVPTPPAEPCDNRQPSAASTAAAAPTASVSSYAVNDLQRMFPTPPSLESCQAFSPEGRLPYPVPYSQNNSVANHDAEPCKREIEKPDAVGFPPEHTPSTLHHNSPSVLQNHPISELYRPLDHLSQLPPHHAYAPSWLVPANIPPIADEYMVALSNFPMNPPSTPIMTGGGTTPCTPGHSSVRTPASVQPPSVSTPGRGGGICSIESVQSYQTPNSQGTSKTSDPHGSAALFMNLLLSDSVMNVFRDKSFDQCALCVCNMNIRGADVELGNLPALASSEAQYTCSCGFSAIRNRMLSVGSGLFLEDELDVVGLEHELEVLAQHKHPPYRALDDDHLLPLVMNHCASPFTASRLVQSKMIECTKQCENAIIRRDEQEALAQALSIGLSTREQRVRIEVASLCCSKHAWKMSYSDVLSCGTSLDLYRLLVSLKPVLQDAIQRKRTTRSFGFTQRVRGPLTWREFCKEAGKNAEPQPIPSFVVGYDHDWLVVSPHALRYWEKLFLEPYSEQRDVAYLVVCPDDEQITDDTKVFFRELSSMFESCRLGRLKPYNKRFADGLIRIGQNKGATEQQPGLAWLSRYSTSSSDNVPSLTSLYVRAFLNELGPMLKSENNLDLTSLHMRGNQPHHVAPQPPNDRMAPPINIGNSVSSRPSIPTQSPSKTVDASAHLAYNPSTAAAIVLYVVDPFQGAMSYALWRCFLSLHKSLPSPIKDHLVLQIVPVDSLLQTTCSNSSSPSPAHILRSLSFSTFAQCRSTMESGANVRSMTGFGPKRRPHALLQSSRERTLHAPLYVLADPNEKKMEPMAKGGDENILYVCYCLSRDQRWLLAAATDQCGGLLESCYINIEVPPRRLALSRKHRVSVRAKAIEKLWKFCVTTCAQFSSDPWRVVVGKLGRLSHAEIRDWAKHLNRRVLSSSGKRASCQQCKMQQKGDGAAFILSACLTSLEPDASLRIMPDVVKSNNFGRGTSSMNQSGQLKTPDDVSCTHIYVFPTSAVTQLPGSNQAGAEEDPYLNQADAGILPIDLMDIEDDLGMIDLPGIMDPTSPSANHNHFSVGDDDVISKSHTATERLLSSDVGAAEDASLLQQPLSLGYLVSTAPPGPLPSWFWAACPQAKHRCPVFMRSALHIQTSVNETPGESKRQPHPLDSNKTSVVLRFVLESYNALSWLTRDPVSRDRRSCLPVHCISLVQLYHTIDNLLSDSLQ